MTDNTDSELSDLLAFTDRLQDVLDEINHEIRRCGDALERHGGRSPEYERRMRTLKENAALNLTELKQARARIRRLQDHAGEA